jgi:hypothetical protein
VFTPASINRPVADRPKPAGVGTPA